MIYIYIFNPAPNLNLYTCMQQDINTILICQKKERQVSTERIDANICHLALQLSGDLPAFLK